MSLFLSFGGCTRNEQGTERVQPNGKWLKGGEHIHWHPRYWRQLDWFLFLLVAGLTAAGFVVLTSAIPPEEGVRGHLIRQGAAVAIGVIAWVGLIVLDYIELRALHRVVYGVNLGLLLLVVLFGTEVNGNKNWLDLKVVMFQPSELAKIFLIITLSHLLVGMERLKSWTDLALPILHVLPVFGLIVLQGDLGTAMVVAALSVALVYGAGFPGKKILAAGLIVSALVVGAVYSHYNYGTNFPLKGYQWTRIDTFLYPEKNQADGGWQVIQSKIAIGSGEVWGKGLKQGTQHSLNYLPFPHTDFVYAVLGEEFGFVGGLGLIILFGLLFFRLATVAYTAREPYGGLLAIGVFALLGTHVLENIGMTMGVVPVTGIPLPFISYGPTALMAHLIAIGLVQSVAARRDPITYDR